MRPSDRITRGLAVALAVAGVASVGWLARNLRAQDGARVILRAEGSEEFRPTPLTPEASQPGTIPPPAQPQQPPAEPALPSLPGSEALAAPSPDGPPNDDPEQNARSFVERNRKEAQEELKKLKEEAERLRTRLGKVEAGIRRWESLLTAPDGSERVAPPAASAPSLRDTPSHLDPIPAAKPATPVRESEPIRLQPVAPPASSPPPTGEGPKTGVTPSR